MVLCNVLFVLWVCMKMEEVSFIGGDVISSMKNKWYGGI